MVYWLVSCLLAKYWGWKITRESRCPCHDVSVRKITAKKCRFVEIKSGLSQSQNVAPFLPVFVGCPVHRNKIVATFFSNVACRQYLLEGLVAISDNSFSVLERKKYVSLKYGASITELSCDINSSFISLPFYIESRSRSITMLCDSWT